MSEFGDNVRREAEKLLLFEPRKPPAGIARVVMTTRIAGLSRAPYDSLNLGSHVGDVPERVRLNRRSVLSVVGRGLCLPVVGEQIHGTNARCVGALHAGTRWEAPEASLGDTDALVTGTPRLPLVTLVADCLPIALIDPERRCAAAVHAGWRGLADGVIERALELMGETWGTLAADVVAWIGPGIGPCCYEVGSEVAARFPERASRHTHPNPRGSAPGTARIDLRAEAQARLLAAGALDENLTGLNLCTSCRSDLFFSHRRATREGLPATGRQAMLVWLI